MPAPQPRPVAWRAGLQAWGCWYRWFFPQIRFNRQCHAIEVNRVPAYGRGGRCVVTQHRLGHWYALPLPAISQEHCQFLLSEQRRVVLDTVSHQRIEPRSVKIGHGSHGAQRLPVCRGNESVVAKYREHPGTKRPEFITQA